MSPFFTRLAEYGMTIVRRWIRYHASDPIADDDKSTEDTKQDTDSVSEQSTDPVEPGDDDSNTGQFTCHAFRSRFVVTR